MSDKNHNRILASQALQQESETILPVGFLSPRGQVSDLVDNWATATHNPKASIDWGTIQRFSVALQRFRHIGFPVYKIMEIMAEESQKHPQCQEGVRSEVFQDMAVSIMEDAGDLTDRISKFVWLKFGSYLCYEPRYGGVSTLPPATQINLSTGNYEHVVYTAIRQEFAGQLTPAMANATFLQSIVQDSIRKYMAAESPIGELDRVYEQYRHCFPELSPDERPNLISQGKGAWGEMYQRLAPLFEVYGILCLEREEELMTRALLGIVTRTYEPGAVMQWTCLLSGGAGCGKSVIGIIMALDTAPAVVITPSDLGKTKTIEQLAGASVVVLDEMDVSVSKRDIAENKSFLSQTEFRLRRAYRRDAEPIKATWTVISTTNSETLPHDDGAGMRRYGLIRLSGGMDEGDKRAAFLVENRRYLQAALVHLHKAGYPINLGADLVALNQETSHDLIEVPDEVHLLSASLETLAKLMFTDSGNLLWMSTKTIWELISNERFHPRRAAGISDTLKSAGWKYRRSQGLGSVNSKFWAPPNCPEETQVVPIHPDLLPTLRKAIAGATVKPVAHAPIDEAPKAPTSPVKAIEPPKLGKDSQADLTSPPGPLDPVQKAQGEQAKFLRGMISKAGHTPPDTDSPLELARFYKSIFSG